MRVTLTYSTHRSHTVEKVRKTARFAAAGTAPRRASRYGWRVGCLQPSAVKAETEVFEIME